MPDAGEGLTEADVVEWHVGLGDHVKVNDPLLDVETAKSVVELPSPFEGVVTAIHVAPGTTVQVGRPIVFIDDGTEAAVAPQAAPAAGVPDRQLDDDAGQIPPELAEALAGGMVGETLVSPELPEPTARDDQESVRPLLVGYGAADEKLVGGATPRRRRSHDVSRRSAPGQPRGDEYIAVDTVRRVTARNVVASRRAKVHTTTFITCDVSETKALVTRLRARREFQGLHVTPLLIWCKAVCLAMRHNPMLNASWAPDADRIVLHHDVNIGIAADTPRGLMVPVLQQAQDRDLVSMAEELTRLVDVAKSGTLQPSDYRNGTFTITNVGGLGLEAGTPIINGPESAILAMGAIARRPWVVGSGDDETIVPRWVTTMSLAFDHRLIDGAVASRFLVDLAALVSDPALAMAY
nr:dihydrolipoamide acetyltransferase family protein [Propionibacterium cyclohexanicum]